MFAIPKLFGIFAPANEIIGLWCNGNTTDSGPVIPVRIQVAQQTTSFLMTKTPLKLQFLAGFFML